jgi:hypothetical protein
VVLHQQHQARKRRAVLTRALKPHFSADNRLDPALAPFFVKLDSTEQISQIRDGQRGLLVCGSQLDTVIDACGSVNDRKFGVKAQVNKHRLHCRKAVGAHLEDSGR